VFESRWPVRVLRIALRPRSGGTGRHPGGAGLLKEVLFLAPASVAALMTRHETRPPGVRGGGAGLPGRLTLIRGGVETVLSARGAWRVERGDVLRIETPGGGGHGRPPRR
jgi:N-methylhydantoinase B/oxoprolinase/acetone carboxylase alpha subunit